MAGKLSLNMEHLRKLADIIEAFDEAQHQAQTLHDPAYYARLILKNELRDRSENSLCLLDGRKISLGDDGNILVQSDRSYRK